MVTVDGNVDRHRHFGPIKHYIRLFYSWLSYYVFIWGTAAAAQNYTTLLTLQKKVLRMFEGYHGHPQGFSKRLLFSKHFILHSNQIYYLKLFFVYPK